jgi:hypothetical protein
LTTLNSKTAILLSKIQIQRGLPLDGLRQLDLALPNILAHCNSKTQGDAHMCRAKCLLAMASRGSTPSDGGATPGGAKKRLSRRTFTEVEQALIDALDGYHAMYYINGMLEVTYLMARLYDSYGNRHESRNRVAAKFAELTKEKQRNMSTRGGGGGGGSEETKETKEDTKQGEGALISLKGIQTFLAEWC